MGGGRWFRGVPLGWLTSSQGKEQGSHAHAACPNKVKPVNNCVHSWSLIILTFTPCRVHTSFSIFKSVNACCVQISLVWKKVLKAYYLNTPPLKRTRVYLIRTQNVSKPNCQLSLHSVLWARGFVRLSLPRFCDEHRCMVKIMHLNLLKKPTILKQDA